MKARRTDLSLKRPACLKTTQRSQKFTGISNKWEGKPLCNPLKFSVLNSCPCLAEQLLGRWSFIADYVGCCCIIFNPTVCFGFVSPNSEKKCNRCKKMFSLQIPSASWTSTHIWWVAGKLHSVETWIFGWGVGQRAFICRDLDTSPDFVTQSAGPCPDLSQPSSLFAAVKLKSTENQQLYNSD